MAKKIIILACILLLGISIFIIFSSQKRRSFEKDVNTKNESSNLRESNPPERKSVFVPYWTLGSLPIDSKSYDANIYFGITPGSEGIDKSDDGYSNLSLFVKKNTANKTYLTVRMVNPDTNFKILSNPAQQKKIISESLKIARDYSFDGVILNLEVSSLPFSSVVDQINTFVKEFYQKSQEANLRFSITLYGDTFSKFRPYDVSYLSNYADSFYIMAYDFHKANGSPGPNFPYSGNRKYGYDFQTMIADFMNVIPKEKITVVFGLFGYDWQVDGTGDSSTQASPLSLNQIKDRFITSCNFTECNITREVESFETMIQYTDADSEKHIVWFEDDMSMEKKQQFLSEKGIKSTSIWAYSFY